MEQILRTSWLKTAEESPQVLAQFAVYTRQIGRGRRNLGEASVLAWAKVNGATAVLDDQAGYKLAGREGIAVTRSLTLIAAGVKEGKLSDTDAENLVDLLRDNEAFFPCAGKDFLDWARGQGYL